MSKIGQLLIDRCHKCGTNWHESICPLCEAEYVLETPACTECGAIVHETIDGVCAECDSELRW